MEIAKSERPRLLLRPREVADLIGVSRTTAYELIAAGTIPSVRLGNLLRVPAAALEKLVAGIPVETEDVR